MARLESKSETALCRLFLKSQHHGPCFTPQKRANQLLVMVIFRSKGKGFSLIIQGWG
jgi:hypothetical protein